MKASPFIVLVIILAASARVPGAAQTPAGGVEHFSKDGLSFDYPAGWTLGENNDERVQGLVLSRAGAPSVITVYAQREPITNEAQLLEAHVNVTAPYLQNFALRLGLESLPRLDEAVCVSLGARTAMGFRMSGRLGGEPATAEVYRIVLGQRLVHLARFGKDGDDAPGAAAWKTLLDTLKVEPPPAVTPEAVKVQEVIPGGTINGGTSRKPPPSPYPPEAKAAGAQGTVGVQVVVDEQGSVVYAKAVSGHKLLRAVSEKAARRAEFGPTILCGHPVRVTGVITYNFVLEGYRPRL